MKTMTFGKIADTVVVLIKDLRPSDEDWSAYLKFLQALPRGRAYRVLLWSGGGSPSADQRKRLEAAIGDLLQNARIALLSGSSIVRGFIAAMSVAYPAYRPFSPFDIEAAFRYLGVEGQDRKAAMDLLATLRDDLSAPALVPRPAR